MPSNKADRYNIKVIQCFYSKLMILFIIETNQFSKTYLYILFIFKTTTYFMKTSKGISPLIFTIVSIFLRARETDWAQNNDNWHVHSDWWKRRWSATV